MIGSLGSIQARALAPPIVPLRQNHRKKYKSKNQFESQPENSLFIGYLLSDRALSHFIRSDHGLITDLPAAF